jgi:hypothetical protein
MSHISHHPHSASERFESNARLHSSGIFSELTQFLMHNKKWWLVPVIAVLVLLGALVILGGTAIAPFIYTLF